MDKYNWGDVVVDPTGEKARSYLGKECHFEYNPSDCLKSANSSNYKFVGKLVKIMPDCKLPFICEDKNGNQIAFPCVILKKNLSPEYAEFKNLDEFSRAYDESCKHVKSDSIGGRLIKAGGVWLIREKTKTNSFYQVGYLYDNGLKVLGWGDVDWEDLFNTFTFLDKAPCGKKI